MTAGFIAIYAGAERLAIRIERVGSTSSSPCRAHRHAPVYHCHHATPPLSATTRGLPSSPQFSARVAPIVAGSPEIEAKDLLLVELVVGRSADGNDASFLVDGQF